MKKDLYCALLTIVVGIGCVGGPAMGQTCDTYFDRQSTSTWQRPENWDPYPPDPSLTACIPADEYVRIVYAPGVYPLDVEAKAIVLLWDAETEERAHLTIESNTSLTIYDESRIDGLVTMEDASKLYIADDLTINGYGGQIDGFYNDVWPGNEAPRIDNIEGGNATLTISGAGAPREHSLVLRGGLWIKVALVNSAYVVADDKQPLILYEESTGTINGHWVAENHPTESWSGNLWVNATVGGSGHWVLTNGSNPQIVINAPCRLLTGPLWFSDGILQVNQDFRTTGDLSMHSGGGSHPVIYVAPGAFARFGS